jgi:hypothetical protein
MSSSPDSPFNWKLVIFASRETPEMVMRTVSAALIAAKNKASIDILVNGNDALALALLPLLREQTPLLDQPPITIWSISMGDKANAWNQYLQHLWSEEEIVFFIDGYVRLNADAISLLGSKVMESAEILGGTGMPSVGRTAQSLRNQMSPHGGFHGNFCCIKGLAVEQLKKRGISLPIGLYRVDSLMGALLSLGLDSIHNNWDANRIFVHPQASWQTDPKRWWHLDDIRAQIKRVLRQSRGELENLAVRDHLRVRKQAAELLPDTASELVLEWAQRCPTEVNPILRRSPFARREFARLGRANIGRADQAAPILVGSI